MEKTWSTDKGRVMRTAYLQLCKMAVAGSAFFYLIYFINHYQATLKWDILVATFIYFLITQVWLSTPYVFSIDTVTNTLTIHGMNLLRKQRIETINLSELDTEIIRDVQLLWIDRRFTFRLIKDDKVVLKIKEDKLGWSHETLQDISRSIQSFKRAEVQESESNIDTAEKVWSINTRRGMWTAYLYLSWYLLLVAVGFFVLYAFMQDNWPDSYWVIYACVALVLVQTIFKLRQFTPYSFSVDTTTNTLLVKGMNLFRQQKSETISLVGLDTELMRALRANGGIDVAFTLTLLVDGIAHLKLKEDNWGWSEEKLRGFHDYIQSHKTV